MCSLPFMGWLSVSYHVAPMSVGKGQVAKTLSYQPFLQIRQKLIYSYKKQQEHMGAHNSTQPRIPPKKVRGKNRWWLKNYFFERTWRFMWCKRGTLWKFVWLLPQGLKRVSVCVNLMGPRTPATHQVKRTCPPLWLHSVKQSLPLFSS